MKIVVPTDFSKLSQVAVDYALVMAKQIGAKIILLQVIPTASSSRVTMATHRIQDAVQKSSATEMAKFMEGLKERFGDEVEITSDIKAGDPVHKVIERYAVKHGAQLIVMGTKGATGLKKVLFGSNAAAVIEHSPISVIAIPEKARFQGVKNMVLATDVVNLGEQLARLKPFADIFKAHLHLLHVVAPNGYEEVDIVEIRFQLNKVFRAEDYTVKVLENEDAVSEIEDYCTKVDADLLTLFSRKHGLFSKLFGKSVGRELATQAKIPLLAMPSHT